MFGISEYTEPNRSTFRDDSTEWECTRGRSDPAPKWIRFPRSSDERTNLQLE